MKNEEILEHIDKMYDQLQQAYEIAGGLRDTFSGSGPEEGKLKDYCNDIRGKIYSMRTVRGQFKDTVKRIPQ